VAIIDEATARRYWWPDHDPVGRRLRIRLRFGQNPVNPWSTVVDGEKYQARRARYRWRAAPLCSAESICRAHVELALRTSLPASTLEAQLPARFRV